jgi:hypothetical protein
LYQNFNYTSPKIIYTKNKLKMSLINIYNSKRPRFPETTRSKTQGKTKTTTKKIQTKIDNNTDMTYDNSLISNRSEIYELLNCRKQELPLDEFKKYTSDILLNYKFKRPREDEHEESDLDMVILEDIEKRKNMFKIKKLPLIKEKNKIKNKLDENSRLHGLSGTTDASLLKIKIPRFQHFKDPYESLEVIKENEKIFQEIDTSLKERKKFFSDRMMEQINTFKDHRIRMPRVKITHMLKANFDLLRQEMEEEEAKKKQEENMNLQKIQVELYNLANPLITAKESPRIHCTYVYANKNFPEGREQFSMYYNGSDIVLYGGLSINRNINVWTLNPGIYKS